MFELMDSYSQNAVIKVIGVGGGIGTEARPRCLEPGIAKGEISPGGTEPFAASASTASATSTSTSTALGGGGASESGRRRRCADWQTGRTASVQ